KYKTDIATMRTKLATDEGVRKKFKAVFSRLGKKVNYNGHAEDTILLINIVDAETGKPVADHVWFSYTKGFEKINLIEGVVISFDARVKQYTKGYVNKSLGMKKRTVDFKLSHPTKIAVL